MDVVLLVDSDLAQVNVEEAGVEAPVSTADKLEIGAVQIVDVDLGIVRFDVGHVEDVILPQVITEGAWISSSSGALSMMSIIS